MAHKYSYRFSYEFKVNELISIMGVYFSKQVTDFVSSNCFISSNSKTLNCISCQKKFYARKRNEFKQIFHRLPIVCDDCKRRQISDSAINKIDILISSEVYSVFPEFKFDDLNSLTYIEKIVLLVLLLDLNLSEGQPVNFNNSHREYNLTGIPKLDTKYLSKLIDIKAIYEVDYRRPESFIKNYSYLKNNIEYLDSDASEKLKEFKSALHKPGMYILIPENYESYNELIRYLYEQLVPDQIDQSVIETISQFVISILLSRAYQLLNEVKSYHRIPINMNLDAMLTSLVKKYPMRVVFNILNYQAERVAGFLFSNQFINPFVKNKLLVKRIDDYLRYLAENQKTPY